MAEEDTTQTRAPAVEPTATPPEAATAPTEPEGTQSEPQPTETQTAQIPDNEPLPPEPEPIAPIPTSEPTQTATASAPVTPAHPAHPARDLLMKARATIQDRKRKKLDKILELLDARKKVTNDEVEKLLHVSDATATRYLSALEK